MLKDIRRMLFVTLLTLCLVITIVPMTYAHDITLTLTSSPIVGVHVWYETKILPLQGPFTTPYTATVQSSDQPIPAPGLAHGAYTIKYELQPVIDGTEYILKALIINGTEVVSYKQQTVHCELGAVDTGYLRVSIFGDTTIEGVYAVKTFGPKIDKLRFKVIRSPDAQLIAMQTCEVDVLTDLIRTGDIEKLDGEGFTITAAPGFHMGFIGFNIRPDQSYKLTGWGSKIAGPVLSDMMFRKAAFKCYNQDEIVASIYKYIVTPVQSLVPPSQGGWVNPAIPKVAYNPGDPTLDTNDGTCGVNTSYVNRYPNDISACGVLRGAGYIYDPAQDNWVTPYDLDGDGTPGTMADTDCDGTPDAPGTEADCIYDNYITDPDDVIPSLLVFTPTYEVAPTSAEHGARFVADCNAIGIPLVHEPREFDPYLDKVYGVGSTPGGEFDLFMVFYSLSRFPDHLYDMVHSSFDSRIQPEGRNAPGIHCDELDKAVETIKFSLDHDAKLAAAYKAQEILYSQDYPEAAFSYMLLYSRIYFNAFKPHMKGIVNSPGYGSDNMWTYLNMHWEEGYERYHTVYTDKTLIIWCLGEVPITLNPCFADTVYEWAVIGPTLDGLMAVNPYTHEDLSWIAWDWEIEKWATEEDVDNLLAGAVMGSHWHEDWPVWSLNWNLTSWTDDDVSGDLSVGDQVDFDHGPEYEVIDMTWDIKVENKECPNEEMKLSGTGAPRPPPPIPAAAMPGTTWHEEWPTRSTIWTCNGFTDNGDGILSRSDQIMLDGSWWHVDSVTVTLHLDEKPDLDGVIDKVVEFAGTGMKVLFWLRDDVYWQDGNRYTAQDGKFSLLFLRDNQIPRYMSSWENIVDVATVGPEGEDHFKLVVYLNVTSQFLIYDLAGLSALLPPWTWAELDGQPLPVILAYDPSTDITTHTIPATHWYRVEYPNRPISTGPWFGERDLAGQPIAAVTNLYGTGPFIFEYYDDVGMYAEEHANRRYFMATIKIQAEKREMFHAIGDADWDGEVGIWDLSRMGASYGYFCYEHEFDAQADVNQDNVVDMRDITMLAFFWGDKMEYPYPQPIDP